MVNDMPPTDQSAARHPAQAEGFGADRALWNLSFLYPEGDDAARAADRAWCRAEAERIERRFAGRVAGLSAAELADLVRDLEALDERTARLESWAFLDFITRTDDGAASARLQEAEELAAFVGRHTVFFSVEWNQLAPDRAEALSAAEALAPYRHYLTTLRSLAPHQLPLAEEQLLRDFAPVGRSAWTTLFDKVMSRMRFGAAGRTESEVLADLHRPDRETRRQAARDFTAGLEQHLHILTHIFNTLAQEKAITDRVRRHSDWTGAVNLKNELRPETVTTLVDTVSANNGIVHRYYRMKRELMGVPELFDYDRYAPLPLSEAETPIPWDAARDTVLAAFADFSPDMARIAEGFFKESRIHAPMLPGKTGGAFAHPTVPSAKPYILVNYAGRRDDVFTLAHELGHGVHQTLAAPLGLYNSDTPLVLAETASVFAEMLVFKAVLREERSPERRRALLCGKLESIFATVFRQVAMHRFEAAMHEGRRAEGELAAERLSELWLDTQRPMFGDSLTLTRDYRLWWSYIPHFLDTPGYVYAYAFGELLVLALYARYEEEGPAFVPAYMKLLAAGGSENPYTRLAPFGIHLDDPTFWQGGLDLIGALVREAEQG